MNYPSTKTSTKIPFKTLKPLGYIGCQWSVASKLLSQVPRLNTASHYAEVFGGSAAVLLQRLTSEVEVYNELNPFVFNFFKILRDYPHDLIHTIRLMLMEYDYPFETYANERVSFFDRHAMNTVFTAKEKVDYAAICWIYSHTSYRGEGDRWNSGFSGDRHTKVKLNLTKRLNNLKDYSDRLQGAFLLNHDAKSCIRTLAVNFPQTFLYIDPPFPNYSRTGKDKRHTSGTTRLQYKYDMLSDREHIDLIQLVLQSPNPFAICTYKKVQSNANETPSLYDDYLLNQDKRDVDFVDIPARDLARNRKELRVYYSMQNS